MKKLDFKSNKGISMADIIIAVIILIMFAGVICSFYYKIVYYNNSIKMNAKAVSYAITIAEDIDKILYEDVETDLLRDKYELADRFEAEVTVKKYKEINPSAEDIIKIVTITINYEFLNENKVYQIEKIKIKE